MTHRLELRDLGKRFGETDAVRSMNLALEPGEFLSLLGPSGCGKSTTLTMIAGFETPSTGEIRVDGALINATPPGRRRIGLVFQDYAVFSRLTVRDNLSFGLEAQGVRRAERRRRVAAMAETLGLGPIMARRGASLNMSEMQRVALARVLVTEPRLLLLDEPMSNLDAALRAQLRGELKQLQKRLRQTVLYVTHDQVEAMAMSDRIAVMHDGVIEQVGAPEDIYHRPATRFVAEFIGDPPINLLPCRVTRDGGRLSAATALHGALELAPRDIDGGDFLIGVRPHDVLLSKTGGDGHARTTVRFVENLGVEHVLHCDYGDDLIALTAPPGFASAGETIWLGLDERRLHLIGREDGLVHQRKDAA
ncbi:ABC transporter ATP-binding protein [Pikeienuella sp. HZG-20]|uniref:ABC transporter ATP-binding protein n=1 Tax=Paludibacillus litoralis TaxID=3133267 RepID=UPI0030EEF0CB